MFYEIFHLSVSYQKICERVFQMYGFINLIRVFWFNECPFVALLVHEPLFVNSQSKWKLLL